MKHRSASFAALTLGLMLSSSAFGAITTITSGGGAINTNSLIVPAAGQTQTNQGPNGTVAAGQTSFNVVPNGAWTAPPAGAGWVSFLANQEPDTTIANGDYVDFFHTFTLAGGVATAKLNIFADDRADVFINEALIWSTLKNAGTICNNGKIGCISANEGVFDTSLNNFGTLNGAFGSVNGNGLNTLRVRVYQDAGGGFGTAYRADFNSVPEPGFYGLLSLGLGGLLVAVQRRRKSAVN